MSDCGCIYVGDVEDGAAFEAKTYRRARKDHRCCECRETILAGTKYQHISAAWEGTCKSFKTCEACAEIRGLLFCEGYYYERMWEDVEQAWLHGTNPMGCIAQLESVAARQKLADRYRDYLDIPEPSR